MGNRFLYLVFLVGLGFFNANRVLAAPDTLTFHCSREEKVVRHVLEKKNFDTFDLFYFISNTDSSSYEKDKSKCDNFIRGQQKKGIDFTKEKNLKKLLKQIHKEFLVKYKLNSHFIHIFQTGEYNCLTSSALYAYILNSLNVPNTVKELPTHVYLTVKLGEKVLDVETTIPEDLIHITKDQKENYVKELLANKIITQKELDEKGTTKVFEEQFYHSTDVNLVQLAGLAYQNSISMLADSARYLEALSEVLISRNLYPRQAINQLGGLLLNTISTEPTRFGPYQVMKFGLIFSDLYDQESLSQSLAQFAANTLFRNNDLQLFLGIDSFVSQNVIRQESKYYRIKETYHKALGEYYQMKSSYALSALHFKQSYYCNPSDIQAPYQIKVCIARLCLQYLDSLNKVDDSAMAFVFSFDFMENDKEFTDVYFDFLWKAFNKNVMTKTWTNARLDSLSDRALKKIEKSARFKLSTEDIEECFMVLMRNHVLYQDYARATEVLKHGRDYLPFSEKMKDVYAYATDEKYSEAFYTSLYYRLLNRKDQSRNRGDAYTPGIFGDLD